MTKQSVLRIADTLTADVICREIGVTRHAVRHARTTGIFPASWYAPLLTLCDGAGIDCPLSAFNWKSASTSEAQ